MSVFAVLVGTSAPYFLHSQAAALLAQWSLMLSWHYCSCPLVSTSSIPALSLKVLRSRLPRPRCHMLGHSILNLFELSSPWSFT